MHAREVKLQDGKCIPVSCDPGYTISDITGQCEEQEEDEDQLCLPNELKELNATFGNKNTGKCIPTKCMEQYELSGNKCKKMSDKDICEKISMGTWKNKKCQCDDKTQNMVNGKCVDDDKKIELKRSSDNAMANIQASIDKESQKQVQACTDSGGTWDDKKKSPCSCSKQKGLTDDIKGFTCKCSQNGYIFQNGKCTKQTSSSNTTNTSGSNSSSWFVDPPQYTKSSSFKCNGITIQTSKANSASELKCVSTLSATSICSTYDKSTGHDVDCDTKTKTCAYSCNDILEKKYYLVCCNINNEDESVTCKGINKIGTYDALTGPKISVADCK